MIIVSKHFCVPGARAMAGRSLVLSSSIGIALLASALATGALEVQGNPEQGRHTVRTPSGYSIEFTLPEKELIGDLLHGERGDPHAEAQVPFREWYPPPGKRHFDSWGPAARHYPAVPGIEHRSLAWKRERVVATAARFLGHGYQHHHVPDWDPPKDWPWKETCVGHNGKGVDCSNFTSFAYNQGFGIHLNSDIKHQSELASALEGQHEKLRLKHIPLPASYEERIKVLLPGDLVYIRGREDGPITHVVLWVGSLGRSSSGAPLHMDSHGADVKDDEGRQIPCGVQLRPFREHSWYNKCASHAIRTFYEEVR
jgi:NlpC/P60 family